MSILINYYKKTIDQKQNINVLFMDKSFIVYGLDDLTLKRNTLIINQFKKKLEIKENNFYDFDLDQTTKVILIKIKATNQELTNEKLGGLFFDYLKKNEFSNIRLMASNIKILLKKNENFLSEFFHGIQLKSYEFSKYKTFKKEKKFKINIPAMFRAQIKKLSYRNNAVLIGTEFTKDLVSEPGNVLHPDEYVNRIKKLKSLGLKIKIFDKKKTKKTPNECFTWRWTR